jgi:hypothetical protein
VAFQNYQEESPLDVLRRVRQRSAVPSPEDEDPLAVLARVRKGPVREIAPTQVASFPALTVARPTIDAASVDLNPTPYGGDQIRQLVASGLSDEAARAEFRRRRDLARSNFTGNAEVAAASRAMPNVGAVAETPEQASAREFETGLSGNLPVRFVAGGVRGVRDLFVGLPARAAVAAGQAVEASPIANAIPGSGIVSAIGRRLATPIVESIDRTLAGEAYGKEAVAEQEAAAGQNEGPIGRAMRTVGSTIGGLTELAGGWTAASAVPGGSVLNKSPGFVGRVPGVLGAIGRVGERALTDAAKFGTFETGSAVAEGRPEQIPERMTGGMRAGLEMGGAFGAAGEVPGLAARLFRGGGGGGGGEPTRPAAAPEPLVRPSASAVEPVRPAAPQEPVALADLPRGTTVDVQAPRSPALSGRWQRADGDLWRNQRTGETAASGVLADYGPTVVETPVEIPSFIQRPEGAPPARPAEPGLNPDVLAERQQIEAERARVMATPEVPSRAPGAPFRVEDVGLLPVVQRPYAWYDPNGIRVDEARFQWRRDKKNRMAGVSRYNQLVGASENLATWIDPADGYEYVVNGNNRANNSQRLGQTHANVFRLPVATAADAKAAGALINIAQGNGTPFDMAAWMRETGRTRQDLADLGVNVKDALGRDGSALAGLTPDLYAQALSGKLPEGWAIAIGDELASAPDLQRQALAYARKTKRKYTDGQMREIARQFRAEETVAAPVDTDQGVIFNDAAERLSLVGPKAEIVDALRNRILADKRLATYLTRGTHAEDVGKIGQSFVDVDAAKATAEQSALLEEMFQRSYTRSGPMSTLITDSARRFASGEANFADIVRDAHKQIPGVIRAELDLGGLGASGAGGAAVPAKSGAGENSEAVAPPFIDPAQEGIFGAPQTPVPVPETSAPIGGERIRSAAVKLADGTVYEGQIHVEAMTKAQDAQPDGLIPEGMESGYVTDRGRFVTSEEATAIAQATKQVPDRLWGDRQRVVAQDFGSGGVPSSTGNQPDVGRAPLLQEPAVEPVVRPESRPAAPTPAPGVALDELSVARVNKQAREAGIEVRTQGQNEEPIYLPSDPEVNVRLLTDADISEMRATLAKIGKLTAEEKADMMALGAEQAGRAHRATAAAPGTAVARSEPPPVRSPLPDDLEGLTARVRMMEAASGQGLTVPGLAEAKAKLAAMEPTATNVEAGAPHDNFAVQTDLLGPDARIGREQTSLLPESAGRPAERLKAGKIQPEETARLAAERPSTTPAGETPLELTPQATAEPVKSKGHVAFFTNAAGQRYELYKDARGELFRAAESDVIDTQTGYRIGRWEAPAHMADASIKSILGDAEQSSAGPPDETGGAHPVVLRTLAGAAGGAAVGAVTNKDDPLRGAALGALAGAGLANAPGILRAGVERFGVSRVGQSIAKTLAPQLRSPEAAMAARTLRAQLGSQAHDIERVAEALRTFRQVVEPLHDTERYAFIDAIETNQVAALPKALQPAANHIRVELDRARVQIQQLGTGKLENFIEHYFPHIWEQPDRAGGVVAQILSRRPLQGSRAFLKQRTIPTTADGVAAGLTPVTTNPLDLTMLKIREMRRYLMAQRTFAELKGQGLLRYVRAGGTIPDGYARINDSIATVFGPREGAVTLPEGANIEPGEVTVPGRRIMGEYWAPEAVANVLNNHLSPGLRGNPIYDAYMGLGNTLNQAQLGLSAFHLGFTSVDAATSRMALGIRQLRGGEPLRAAVTALSTPVAPLTNLIRGDRLLKAYLRGTGDQALAEAVNSLELAGGRVKMDTFYRTDAGHTLLEAVRTGKGLKALAVRAGAGAAIGAASDEEYRGRNALVGAALGAFGPALLEQLARPIMEYAVPRQKLGVFFDLARYEMEKLPATATVDEAKAVLQRSWDSVDNRLGQMVYDNLFWNRTLKDLSMASVRAVGWNLGTIRELGGGALDLARLQASSRSDYLLALPITVGLMGATMTYLYTGHGPETLKDYFYPPTGQVDREGNIERVQLPSYMKDIAAYSRHPIGTVTHKLHPEIGMIMGMLQNQDYYGDKIRNEHDPIVTQAEQVAKYIGTQFVPIGIRNVAEVKRRTGGVAGGLPSFVGVTPARREDVRTDAQNRMMEYLGGRRAEGRTPQEQATAQRRTDMLEGLRSGTRGRPDLQRAVRAHEMSAVQAQNLWRQSRENPTLGRFKQLTLDEAEEIYGLGTPDEQKLWLRTLRLKRVAERQKYRAPALAR